MHPNIYGITKDYKDQNQWDFIIYNSGTHAENQMLQMMRRYNGYNGRNTNIKHETKYLNVEAFIQVLKFMLDCNAFLCLPQKRFKVSVAQ